MQLFQTLILSAFVAASLAKGHGDKGKHLGQFKGFTRPGQSAGKPGQFKGFKPGQFKGFKKGDSDKWSKDDYDKASKQFQDLADQYKKLATQLQDYKKRSKQGKSKERKNRWEGVKKFGDRKGDKSKEDKKRGESKEDKKRGESKEGKGKFGDKKRGESKDYDKRGKSKEDKKRGKSKENNTATVKFEWGAVTGIKGTATFKRYKDKFTEGTITVTGLTPNKEYPVHVHEKPANKPKGKPNPCDTTGAHFDPKGDGVVPCGSDKSKCQEGDLSGKWGKLKADAQGKATLHFQDQWLKFDDLKGRSIVIHNYATAATFDKCGNIDFGKDYGKGHGKKHGKRHGRH